MLIEKELFDQWASKYENDIYALKDVYPFAGYFPIIDHIRKVLSPNPSSNLLDLGVGTGLMLSEILIDNNYSFNACDFSDEMVAFAKNRLNSEDIFVLDIRKNEIPKELKGKVFDCIYSAYTFHHFDLTKKIEIVQCYLQLLKPGGQFLIADISFDDENALSTVKQEAGERWDTEEEDGYWRKNEALAAFQKHNLAINYTKISFCAGIYRISLKK